MLNQTVAAEGELPTCQDTGTAICIGKKGENVFTGADDAECIARGAYEAYKERNLRYSQVVPFTMTEEKNSGTNLPAQIDLYADKGNEYKFLFITKGGGSANKTFLYQQTKAALNEKSLLEFFRSKLMDLGTSACPPYHLAVCIGGTSAEMCLATVKKASAGYLDQLPTSGNEGGRLLPRPGVGTENPPDLPGERYRRPVRRQIPRTRRAGDPRSAPRGVVPRRHRRKLLGRPQHQSQNYRRGHLPRTAREEPGPLPAQRGPRHVARRGHRPGSRHGQGARNPLQISDQNALNLRGTLIVARDIAHARIKQMLDEGKPMPEYFKKHPIYYAGPAKTPKGMPSGSFGPTTAGRMDPYVDLFQEHGGSLIMLAKGNRSQQVTDACRKHGGFYLGSIGGPAAVLAKDSIKSVEVVDFPELGMEAVRKIYVENFPAFILVDDKGNDFFAQLKH